MRALRKLQRESAPSPFGFSSERGAPFATTGFAKVERAGEAAGFAFKAHAHMLRHACGFALANAGHDTRSLQAYLGHRNIKHTVRYTTRNLMWALFLPLVFAANIVLATLAGIIVGAVMR
jgi:site-specific recombinase XerD